MKLFQNEAEINIKKEYQCFLDYLEVNEVSLVKRTMNIGKKDCFALNSLFQIVSERYASIGRTQEYFTVIDFFCFFSVHTGILQYEKKRGKGILFKRSQRYHTFSQMSAMEQYILMMSVWLGEYREASNKLHRISRERVFEMIESKKVGQALAHPYDRGGISWGSDYNSEIRLLALFQLIHIEWLEEHEEDKENKFRIKAIYLTAEGCFLKKLLEKQRREYWYAMNIEEVLPLIETVANTCGVNMEEKLIPFLENPVEKGLCTVEFKVAVGSCIRKIKMGDQLTLKDLHYQIQKSVDFDMDHLYFFQIGTGTSMRRYFAPECAEEYLQANTTSLAELSLYEGMQFEYLFDFGDEWRFMVTVEHILRVHTKECEISITKGESPDQYGDWY